MGYAANSLTDLWAAFAAVAAGALLLFSGLAMALRSRPGPRGIPYLIFAACIAWYCLVQAMNLSGGIRGLPSLLWSEHAALFLAGPGFYLFFSAQVDEAFRLRWWHLTHAIPFLGAVALTIAPGLLGERTLCLAQPQSHGADCLPRPLLLLASAGEAWLVGYALVIAVRLRAIIQQPPSPAARRAGWITVLFAVDIALIGILHVAGVIQGHGVARINMLAILATVVAFFLVDSLFPAYFPEVLRLARRGGYARSRLQSAPPLEEIARRLEQRLEVDRVFTNENLTLADLAAAIDLSPHQLSEFLNNRLGVTFRTLLNRRRILEARTLLEDPERRTVLEIAFEVGFGNKASFNAAFPLLQDHGSGPGSTGRIQADTFSRLLADFSDGVSAAPMAG